MVYSEGGHRSILYKSEMVHALIWLFNYLFEISLTDFIFNRVSAVATRLTTIH